MKNVKKKILTLALLTTFVLCLGGAFVFGSLQPVSVKADGITSFVVVEGASIRQAGGITASGKEVKNGLRFMSEISVADYESLGDNGGEVNCGVFIMPYSYIESYGAITEANCFGAGNVCRRQ